MASSGLEIPKLMDAYNMKVLSGDDKAILGRMRYHWQVPPDTAATCTGCGACEAACTQQLPIIERMEDIAAVTARAAQEKA